MNKTSFFTEKELHEIGFKKIGRNNKISKYAHFYDVNKISIGNNVRVDDFCILSGNIHLGSYIHISAFCALYGQSGIEVNEFCGLSPRCTVLSATDDFSGKNLVGPMVPHAMRGITSGKVILEKYAHVGTGSIIMPGVVLSEGACVGALSFVKENVKSWSIYAGIPAKYLKKRSKEMLAKSKGLD